MAEERIRFVDHNGTEILVIDLGGLVEGQIVPVLVEAAKLIRTHPPASLRTLTDGTDTILTLRSESGDYDRATAEAIRSCIAGNGPYVRAAAISLGHAESKRVIVEFFSRAGDRHFQVFDSATEALDWLASVE